MKLISIFVLITSAVTAFSISSCNKDELTPRVNGNLINTTTAPYTIDLIAARWSKVAMGVYTCSFLNIIPPGYRNNSEIKVYLRTANETTLQINDPILFMGGELSANNTPTDITINYRCNGELPFDYLEIKVEIE